MSNARPDLPVSRETEQKLLVYQNLIDKWQSRINLVGGSTLSEIRQRHFLDSMQLTDFIEENMVLHDWGSGAGFPGLVLAITRPDIEVHLVEADTRKCAFLSAVSRETKTPVTIHNCRIEDLDRDKVSTPNIITARALAPLVKIMAMALPWMKAKPEIVMLLPKGENAAPEIADAEKQYNVDYRLHPSRTSPEGCVLEVRGLCIRTGD